MTDDTFAKDVRNYVLDYIKHSDAKVAALLTAVGLLGAGVWAVADRTIAAALARHSTLGLVAIVASLAWVTISLVLTLIFSAQALIPRVPKAAASLASFPDIASNTQAWYVEQIAQLKDAEAMSAEYAAHAWTLSKINMEKTVAISRAVKWIITATLGSLLVLIVNTCTRCAWP